VGTDVSRAEGPPTPADLAPTFFIDFEAPELAALIAASTAGADAAGERLARWFDTVRDGVRYDPYCLPVDPGAYRASAVAARGRAYCVPKAVLFVAGCRALGLPARLGFADVRNHLQTARLAALMGSDLFRYHGYGVVWVGGRWVKASPAFNRELCERFGVPPLAFDGHSDALLHPYAADGGAYMEYVAEHGTFADLPLAELLDTYRTHYGRLLDRGA
jgi:transglutaminase-like putative cysteine protease